MGQRRDGVSGETKCCTKHPPSPWGEFWAKLYLILIHKIADLLLLLDKVTHLPFPPSGPLRRPKRPLSTPSGPGNSTPIPPTSAFLQWGGRVLVSLAASTLIGEMEIISNHFWSICYIFSMSFSFYSFSFFKNSNSCFWLQHAPCFLDSPRKDYRFPLAKFSDWWIQLEAYTSILLKGL